MTEDRCYRMTLIVDYVCEGESTTEQAEKDICDCLDKLMFQQKGHNEIMDKKRPRIYDYTVNGWHLSQIQKMKSEHNLR